MKHLFASCAVIALMAAPALAQSTYDPTAPIPESEMMPEQTEPETMTEADEIAPAYAPEDEFTADDEVTVADDAEDDTAAAQEPVTDDQTAEIAADDEVIAETETYTDEADTTMIADAEAVDAPIDVAELPEDYSTADLNALMLASLNQDAVEIAQMDFVSETETETFAVAEASESMEAESYAEADTTVSQETAVTEDYASTQSETYAETDTWASTETETTVTEDYAASTESETSTYAETETSAAPEADPLMQDYAATETLPEDEATLADETTVQPEAYTAMEPSQNNAAPPYDSSAELADESGSFMMAEQPGLGTETDYMGEGDIDQTAVEIAAADGRFSTLVELVTLAGLEDALNAEGPYTVFAPTDEAFAALPETTLAHLRSEEGKEELAEILKSHVAQGAVMAGEVPLAGQEVQTLGAEPLNVTGSVDGTLNVEGSTTVGEGVSASNGVVYAIDTVILPEAEAPTVVDDTEG